MTTLKKIEGGFVGNFFAPFHVPKESQLGHPDCAKIGDKVAVCLEWQGVDQKVVLGEVVHIESNSRVGVRLEWETGKQHKKRVVVAGVLVWGDVTLAASSASRSLGEQAWRLCALIGPTCNDIDDVPGMKTTRSAIVAAEQI